MQQLYIMGVDATITAQSTKRHHIYLADGSLAYATL